MPALCAIEQFADQRFILPCLTLLYSGIHVLSSLEAGAKETVESRFTRRTQTYLLPRGIFNCSALDLYAARCAVVHTFTCNSRLSDTGKARTIMYSHPVLR